MNYEKACQSDILECIKLKNNVISHLKSIGVNIWDEDYPSDELIKNDIMFSNARVVKNEGEIIAYLCFYDPNIEYNESTNQMGFTILCGIFLIVEFLTEILIYITTGFNIFVVILLFSNILTLALLILTIYNNIIWQADPKINTLTTI